jgi:hypothetical protein
MWDQQVWRPYAKHRPEPKRSWPEQVDRTRNDDARYAPWVDIEQIETQCAQDEGNRFRDDRRPTVRRYWLDAGTVIGASNGNETSFVYVEWHSAGFFHGRPITRDELRRKGAF